MKSFLTVIAAVVVVFGAIRVNADEGGIFVPGEFTGVCSSEDNTIYLLAKDHRLIRIDKDGAIHERKLPAIKDAAPDDYLCDLDILGNKIAFCGYAFSGIFELNLEKPEKLEFIELSLDKKPLKPLMIAKTKDGWRIKDAEERVLQISAEKSIEVLPEYSGIEPDKYGKAVVIPPPEQIEDKIIYPGKVFRIDGTPLWSAPEPEAPRVIMSVEYLGFDRQQRDVFLVLTASGELDTEATLYAVKHGRIVASRRIPASDAPYVMRYCRLASDGAVLLVLADPNGREGVIVKRLKLETTVPAAG